jgi:hypothetical protein
MHDHAAYLVDGATGLLVFIPVAISFVHVDEMKKPARWLFRLSSLFVLVILAATVIIGNTWLRTEDVSKRETAASESSDTLNSILNYVSHPPKLVTQEDLSKFAKTLMKSQTRDAAPYISDEILLKMAENVQKQMLVKNMEYVYKTEAAYSRFITAPAMQGSAEPNEVRQKRLQGATQQIGFDLVSDGIVEQATGIRDLMLKRFGNTAQTKDLTDLIERMKTFKKGS